MDKPKFLYHVQSMGGRDLHVLAASGDQAKRMLCKELGIRPGDYWCGVRSMTARKLKPDEVKAWEAQADTDYRTYLFIQGMLEIGAQMHEKRKATTEGVTQ